MGAPDAALQPGRFRPFLVAGSWLTLGLAILWVATRRAGDLLLANHDIGWFLHAGAVWLDGGRIGVDVIDTNPPLIVWLSGLEVWLARLFGIRPLLVHAGATAGITLAGVGLALRALRAAGLQRDVLALWAPLVLAGATAVAGYDLGQRDHWLALLFLPYACWSLAPSGARLERAIAAFLAAVGIALKPHFVLAALAIEVLVVLRSRSLRRLVRVETVVILACGLLYLLAIQGSAPGYWTDVRDTLGVYSAYDRPVTLLNRHTGLALLALLAASVGGLRPRTAAPALFALLALCGVAAARLQGKGFAYHHVPTDVFASAALALSFGLIAARGLGNPAAVAAAQIAVSLAAVAGLVTLPRHPWDRELRTTMLELFARHPGEGAAVFSTSVGATFPAANFAGVRLSSPYSCLWPIAGCYTPEERTAAEFPYRDLAALQPQERRLVENVVMRLVRERPALLAFDRRAVKQAFGRTSFDFRRYFSAHPEFVKLLASYRVLARNPYFEYYERRDV